MSKRRTLVALLVLGLLAPVLLQAQDGTVTWLIEYEVDRSRGSDFVDLVKAHWGPATEEQIEAGNVNMWGIAGVANYRGGTTHLEWLSYPNWEAAAKAEAAWDEAWEAKSETSKDAYRLGLRDMLDRRSTNMVSRSVVRRELASPTEPPKYIVVGTWQTLPGMASAGTRLYTDHAQPVYEELLASQAISGFGLAVPAFHDTEWSHYSWFSMKDLGAMTALEGAFAEIRTDSFDAQVAKVFDEEKHYDTLYSVIHLRGGGR